MTKGKESEMTKMLIPKSSRLKSNFSQSYLRKRRKKTDKQPKS